MVYGRKLGGLFLTYNLIVSISVIRRTITSETVKLQVLNIIFKSLDKQRKSNLD